MKKTCLLHALTNSYGPNSNICLNPLPPPPRHIDEFQEFVSVHSSEITTEPVTPPLTNILKTLILRLRLAVYQSTAAAYTSQLVLFQPCFHFSICCSILYPCHCILHYLHLLPPWWTPHGNSYLCHITSVSTYYETGISVYPVQVSKKGNTTKKRG